MADLPALPIMTPYDDTVGLADVAPALQPTTTHVLYLMGAHSFLAKWDEALQNRYALCKNKKALLTACILRGKKSDAPQAYLPTFVQTESENQYSINPSMALINSKAPVQTLVVDSRAFLTPVSFLFGCDPALDTLSVSAYVAEVPVYVLDEPLFCPLETKEAFLYLPQGSPVLNKRVEGFKKNVGISDTQSDTFYRGRLGLFHRQPTYQQCFSLKDRLQQKWRAHRQKAHPLLVSAVVDIPHYQKSSQCFRMQFGFLQKLKHVSLLLFTQGTQESALRKMHPNTLNFPNVFIRQADLVARGMTYQHCFCRSKMHMIKKAIRTNTEYTHVGWINADALTYPLPPDVMPLFEELMDDRIHIATVGGVYDTSFFIVPVDLVDPLLQAVEDCTYWDVELNRDFSELAMVHRLVSDHTDWFLLHPMPAFRLLFLTTISKSFLSQSHARLLSDGEYFAKKTKPKEITP